MNEKITFPKLASLLADSSGRSKRFSEDFLREFFALISERLEAGESVKVKGLGTFRLSRVEPRRSVDVTTGQPMEISGHSKVVFTPAKELAEAVNAPFEAFTAIEISDDIDISQLLSEDEIALKQEPDDASGQASPTLRDQANATTLIADSTENITNKDGVITPVEAVKEPSIGEKEADSSESKDKSLTVEEELPDQQSEEVTHEASDEEKAPEDSSETDEAETSEEEAVMEEDEFEEDSGHRRSWIKILMISFGAAMVAIIATLAVWYIFAADNFNIVFQKPLAYVAALSSSKSRSKTNSKETPAVSPDTVKVVTALDSDSLSSTEEPEVPTAPSDAVVYDTIGTTRYLTTMAKSHYGNYNLWPYIYEENKSFLGHPDRIRPGTPVVIPKLSKYGVDPNNEEHIEKAKKMGMEIYARYGKKI